MLIRSWILSSIFAFGHPHSNISLIMSFAVISLRVSMLEHPFNFSRRMRLVYPNLIDSRCILTSRETHFFHRIYCFTTSIHLFKDTSRTEMIWRVWVYRIDEVYFNLFHISLSINCGTTRRTKANAAITNCEYNQLTKSFID